MSGAFEDIPADVGTKLTFQTSPTDDTFMAADVSFASASPNPPHPPPNRAESPELPALPIAMDHPHNAPTSDDADIEGISHEQDEPQLLDQPKELQIAISPVVKDFKPLGSDQKDSETWHSDFASFQAAESKEATPTSDFGDFSAAAAANSAEATPSSAAAPAPGHHLTVKSDDWGTGDFHASPPVSPVSLPITEALKHVEAGNTDKLAEYFKTTFPKLDISQDMSDSLLSEPNLDDFMKKTFEGLPDIAQNLAKHCDNGGDILKAYEKDFFKWDQSFVETFMFRSMGIAYPSERLTSSVFESKTSLQHRTSLVGFHQDNLSELKDFDDKSELPDFKGDPKVNQESLGVDATPLDLKDSFRSPTTVNPHLVKMSSMELLQEAINEYADERDRKSLGIRQEEEKKLQELLYGTSSDVA